MKTNSVKSSDPLRIFILLTMKTSHASFFIYCALAVFMLLSSMPNPSQILENLS